MKIEGDIVDTGRVSAEQPTSKRMPAKRWIIGITVFLVIVGGGTSYASLETLHRIKTVEAAEELVSKGSTVDGVPIGGLTRKQLESRVGELAKKNASRMGLTVIVDGKKHEYTAEDLGITFDTSAAIQSAWTSNKPKTFREKLMAAYGKWHPAAKHVSLRWSRSNDALVPGIARNLSDQAYRAPVDGTMELVEFTPTIKPGVDGQEVSAEAISQRMNQAIKDQAFSTPIEITPTVLPAQQIAKTPSIVVNRGAHTVTLYDGSTVVKQYPCAVGLPEYPTPTGDFQVASKQVDPTWVNPHSAWSESMPDTISGGPDNPLGERALALSVPAVLIHGIPASEYSSIGSDASHGCIRMMPDAILDLFGRVEAGTSVYIR